MISMVLSLLQYKRIRQRRIRKVLRFAQNPVVRAISGLDQIEFKKSFCSPPTSEFYKLFYPSGNFYQAIGATVITKANPSD